MSFSRNRRNLDQALGRSISVLAVVLAAALAPAAAASPLPSSDCAGFVAGNLTVDCTLAELYGDPVHAIAGKSATVLGTTFSNWRLIDFNESLEFVDPSKVIVRLSSSGNSIFLDFFGNLQFSTGGLEGHYTFAYTVIPPGAIAGVGLSGLIARFSGAPDAGVEVNLFESGTDPSLDALSITGSGWHEGVASPPADASTTFTSPRSPLDLSTQIYMSGGNDPEGGPSSTVDLQQFREIITVVPEPGTLALFALALGGIGLARRRTT